MQLLHFIICDDVRNELGQKHSLMGILDDDVTIQTPPGFVGSPNAGPVGLRLAAHVRLRSDVGEPPPDLAEVTVSANGNAIARAVGPIRVDNPGRSINLSIMLGVVPLPGPGEITIALALRARDTTLLAVERRMIIRFAA
jgi:hypothetical protein